MGKYSSHISSEQLAGKYTKEDQVILLSDFQDDIIRDYRTRFSGALANRKYFTRSLELTAKEYGISEMSRFQDLRRRLDDVGNKITSLRNDVIRKERVMSAFRRTLPGEELRGLYDVVLSDGRERARYDAVAVTPYGVFVIMYVGESGTLDADGFMHPAGVHKIRVNVAYAIMRKEEFLRRKLSKYKTLPVYSMLLKTDSRLEVKDRYGKIEISSLKDVLSDIRGKSDGKRCVTTEEMRTIVEMMRQNSEAAECCTLDLKKTADEYAWFVSECSRKNDSSLIGKIRSALRRNTPDRPETEIA